MKNTEILKDTTELRKLIIKNPELPLVILASNDVWGFDWDWTYCSKVTANIGEILDCEVDFNDEHIYDDREDFADDIYDYYYTYRYNTFEGSDKEFDDYIEEQIKKYDEYWKNCIIVYVDN